MNPTELATLRAYRLARVREQLVRHDSPAILLHDPVNLRYAAEIR